MTSTSVVESAREWFTIERPRFERYAESVRTTVESLISQAGIDYLSVTARVKEPDSFAEKIERKGYTNPQREMTDIVGLRVIAYIESDVDRICQLIRTAFHIDESNSLDKKNELGRDRFGYRSVHFVCDLGAQRLALPENKAYKDYRCEIQVRTVLQHAWAEMHHDRGYKFASTLPSDIERRLFAQAAILEQADREFARLAKEIDSFAEEVRKKAAAGELDVELTTESLLAFLPRLRAELPDLDLDPKNRRYDQVADELRAFGIHSVRDLEQLISADVVPVIQKRHTVLATEGINITGYGALRIAMMWVDLDRYLRDSFKKQWGAIDQPTVDLLAERHGTDRVHSALEEADITIVESPPERHQTDSSSPKKR